MIGCMKATATKDGGVFASLKKEHTPGLKVYLTRDPLGPDTPYPVEARICIRCRLVYVPEENDDPDPPEVG